MCICYVQFDYKITRPTEGVNNYKWMFIHVSKFKSILDNIS